MSDFHPGDIVSGEGHVVCGRCRNCMAGPAPPVRALDRPRRAAAGRVRRARGAADDEHLAPLARRRRGRGRDLRPVRQRRPHGAHVPGARRGRARHRRRPDRLHGGRGRAPRRRAPRRRLRPEPVSPRARAADGRDGDGRPDGGRARRDPARARDDRGLRRRARDVGPAGGAARAAAGDGPRRPDRAARDPDRRGADRLHPDRLQHADAEGHLRPRDVRDLVPDVGDGAVRPRHQPGDHAPVLVSGLRGGVRGRRLGKLRQGDTRLDRHL